MNIVTFCNTRDALHCYYSRLYHMYQLLEVCIHALRLGYALIAPTTEWAAMPDSIKNEVREREREKERER